MKHVTQNYKTGRIRTEETPEPALRGGGVLVRTAYSVISTGTEGMKAREGKMSYLEMARARPDQVRKVISSVRQQGLAATYAKVMNRLDSLTPLGYSVAGTVVEAGAGAAEFTAGQRVACAGAGYANHAELNWVPKNLVVPVPESVPLRHAAFATVGGIAMQAYRQANLQLGETACVLGLGLIGQLLVQVLRAAGIRVVGVDLDPARCELAARCGALAAFTPADPALPAAVRGATGGAGADAVFLCTAAETNEPVELAAALARDRARIIDVGKTRLDLPWKEFYEKELEVRFSRSYGPGRYDPTYEEHGVDYPIGYVRWTERRNLAAFVELLAAGALQMEPLIAGVFPLEQAEQVYGDLVQGKLRGIGMLFEYDAAAGAPRREAPAFPASTAAAPVAGEVGVGAIGAGNYASTMLLPHLGQDRRARLREVATRTPLSAANAARKFGFARGGTDHRRLLAAPDIQAVLIATRHASHAALVDEALRSGKAVFVEKPLAIDLEGLERVRRAIVESGNERLQVGFNRRFAPAIRAVADALATHRGALSMHYRVHAGPLEAGSWYADGAEGTRFAGEAGHFFDVFAVLAGARPVSVHAAALRPASPTADDLENRTVTVTYDNGSVGCLQYLTQGSPRVPKERLEVFGGGRTVELDNFERLTVCEGNRRSVRRWSAIDKGQAAEMKAFIDAVASGGSMPVSVQSLIDTTLITLAAGESLRRAAVVELDALWAAPADSQHA